MSLRPGQVLGPYEILAPLGAGGMGEVYRARDTRLDREVAVKVLPDRTARDEHALARFRRETKALAALSHPNILMILDVGEHEGVSYAVMELLEGESLRERLRREGLDWQKAVELAAAVADGLAVAHARGIVHRDLKPENVFVTRDGVVKILDFGLAQTGRRESVDPANATFTLDTQPGQVMGTASYMSPEQVRGQPTDPRSDIFSLGCVFHEMLTGKPPFARETTAETMAAILREPPAPMSTTAAHSPRELAPIVSKCLEKSSEQRFQSAHDLAFTLRSVLGGTSTVFAAPRAGIPWPAKVVIVTLVAGGLLLAGFLALRKLGAVGVPTGTTIGSLAVLPLENVSRDAEEEYFVDGMTEALISDLAKIGGLRVISRTSTMRYKATTKSLPEIARELNVDAVVEGSVLRVGDRVRITAQLIHAATDRHLWAETYDRELGDVLRLHSEVARAIAGRIKVTLTPQEQARMAAARPVDSEAYEAYLRGRFYWNKRSPEGIDKAVEHLERAVSLAPDWALGHAALADAYVLLPQYASKRPREAMPKASAAAVKALQLDESLGEAHATLAMIASHYDWNWAVAGREFQRALELSPNYATAHHWHALYLMHTGRADEAVVEMERAQQLDPLSLIIGSVTGMARINAGRPDLAEAGLRKTLELGPDYPMAHLNLGGALLRQGREAEAIAEAREAVRLSNHALNFVASLGAMCARAGQREEARRILEQLEELSTRQYVPPTQLARIHGALGEPDRMFAWLDRAVEERDAWLNNLLIEPFPAPLRSDPRFLEIYRRVGMPVPPPGTPHVGR